MEGGSWRKEGLEGQAGRGGEGDCCPRKHLINPADILDLIFMVVN